VASTLQQTPDRAATTDDPGGGGGSIETARWRRYPALGIAAVLLVLSLVAVLWARTRPGFDPYGWLVWGHQTITASLDTNAAPSWKPLPYLFVVPYAVFGHYELWLWMITAVAVAFSGVFFAGAIAYRLTGTDAGSRYPALAGAVFAGLALLGIADYPHYILSFQSDPMIVSLCLGAIYMHLIGRPRWAFVFGALAALGRPEVWPFLAIYTIWAWRAIPSMRWLLIAGTLVVLLLWFGIPALTSRSPFVAASNAMGSGRRLHSNQVFGTIGRFLALHEPVVELVALAGLGLALWRRQRIAVVLAGGVVAWVVVEIAFALHGWPGLGRYMFEAAGVMVALAGAAVGRLLVEGGRVHRFGNWASVALVALVAVSLVPPAISHGRTEHKDLHVQRVRTAAINRLGGVVSRLGGATRFKPCGEPLTRLEYQTILAWTLQLNVSRVGFKYGPAIHSSRPIVLFTPLSNGGWKVQALHQHAAECRSLPR
jgi:hypothetical protein